MLVKEWMNTDVITVKEDTSMSKASKVMKEHKIRSLPVINRKGRLVGIVTDRDIRTASPSLATSFDVNELHYLLGKVKVRDIMTSKLVFVKPDETVEFATILMLDNKISSLPVLNNNNELVGIITQTDIFKALVNITGICRGGVQFAFSLEDRPGSIKQVCDVIRSFDARVISILSTHEGAQEGQHHVSIRVQAQSKDKEVELAKKLKSEISLLYLTHDYLGLIETRRSKSSNFQMPYYIVPENNLSYVSQQ